MSRVFFLRFHLLLNTWPSALCAGIEVWQQTSPTTWTIAQLPTGATYSTGSPATAAASNTAPITVDVVQMDAAGGATVVASFELAPGASVDVTTQAGAPVGGEVRFHVLRGRIPLRLGGRTRTFGPGTVTRLQLERNPD